MNSRLLKNQIYSPHSPQQLDSGATTDNALSDIECNSGNNHHQQIYGDDDINDNLTHSEKRKIPQILRPSPMLNDSNVSSIMQVSFARQPEGKGTKMRSNSEYQGNNSIVPGAILGQVTGIGGGDVRLKTQPDQDKDYMQQQQQGQEYDDVNNGEYSMFGGVFTQVGDISIEGEKSLIQMLNNNNRQGTPEQMLDFQKQQQNQGQFLKRDLFGAKEENQNSSPSSLQQMLQQQQQQQNQNIPAGKRRAPPLAPNTTPITQFKPTSSAQSSPEMYKLQGRSSQYFQNRRVSKTNHPQIPHLNIRETTSNIKIKKCEQEPFIPISGTPDSGGINQSIKNQGNSNYIVTETDQQMLQGLGMFEPRKRSEKNLDFVMNTSPHTRQQELNMIQEGATNQQNISTARGFGMSSRMKEISVNGIDQYAHAGPPPPQNYKIYQNHDIIQFKDDESVDELMDPDLVGSITDRSKFMLQCSTNKKFDGMSNPNLAKNQEEIDDNESYASSSQGLQSNIPSLPSSTRNSQPAKNVQKVLGGGRVKIRNLPLNKIPALQLSGGGGGTITPSELGTGFVTPSTSALQCKRGQNGLSSLQSSAQIPRYHHKHSSSSVSHQINNIIPKQVDHNTKSRDNSKTQMKCNKGRSVTPNVSSSKKYISQGGMMMNNTNNMCGPLNSSRYSQIQRKKRDDISIQVANILNSHNNRNTRQSSIGSHRYSSLDPMLSNHAAERSFANNNNNSLIGARIQQNYINNNTMSDLSKQLSIDLQRNNTMAMMDSQPISQEVSMLQPHNHHMQSSNVARTYIQNQQRMEQQTSELIRRSEKLKLQLLTQFDMNNPSSRRSTSVPPQKFHPKQSQQNSFSQNNTSSNQVSPKCVNNTINSSQLTMPPSSTTASSAPNSINLAIQKTIQAANDKNTQILSRVDHCKKEVGKMRDDLNDIVIKNIQLQQKTSSFSQKAQEQSTRIARLEMKLRARTQELNELQSNSQVFLSKVKKGQTSFVLSFQNYKKQCELRINTLLKRDQVAIKEISKLKECISKLQVEALEKSSKISEMRDNLNKKSQRLKIIQPQFNQINNERKDLKLQVQKMRNLQKDLAARENQIKLAEKNYYKSISSSTLDELRKFDKRQTMILQQLNNGKQNIGSASDIKQQTKNNINSNNFFGKSKLDENQQIVHKHSKEKEQLFHQMRELQKRKNKHTQTVRKFQWEKKELLNEKTILQEKQKRWQAEAMNNKTSRWANIIFGIILGVILMALMNSLK